MELSSLLDKLKKTPSETPQLFLAIQIDAELIKTAIWLVVDQTTKVMAIGPTQEWDGSSTEILLESVDTSLSPALEKLPEEIEGEPNQVIFGLPQTWVGAEGVTPARLKDLKHICEKLDLQPVGFVITTEAITHYLKAKEGTPLSAILIRVSTTEVVVVIVRLGKIIGTHVVGRSTDLASDVHEGLTRFGPSQTGSGEQESLPSRMILYNGKKNMQDLNQQLMAFDWQSKLPFLHLPQIETVPESFSITAISMAGGSEVAKSLGFTIAKVPHDEETEKPTEPAKAEKKNGDQPETATPEKTTGQTKSQAATPPTSPDSQPRGLKLPSFSPLLTKLKLLPRLFSKASGLLSGRLGLPSGLKLTAVIVLVLLFLAATGVIYVAKHLPQASVRVTFASQSLNQRLRITIDPNAKTVDPESNLLPAEKVTNAKSGKKSQATSGSKTVGERASGEVTIYNRRTDGSKTFAAGTTINADNLVFSLDSETTVASASSSIDSDLREIITPGKATVSVTANAIGPERNLDSGTEFQVANFSKSVYLAKNESAFSGGSEHEIQAVSKKDQQELKNSLLENLKSEAAGEAEVSDEDRRVFGGTSASRVTNEKFSAAVGDEASSLSLEMTVEVTTLAVLNEDLNNLLSALLRDAVPEGFSLATSDLNISEENVEITENSASFDAIVQAKLSPATTPSEIADQIAGKRPKQAVETLKALAHFESVELELKPNLPPVLRWIPASPDRITVEIQLE